MSKAELLDHAVILAGVGLRPVPMVAETPKPALKGWRERLSCDPSMVRALFAEARWADGLAVATGGDVFVVDLDRNHAEGVDGVDTMRALISRNAPLPEGPRVRTPRGGLHVYLRADRRVPSRTAILAGLDVKGEGGLAIVPPTVRHGRAYRWGPDPRSPIPYAPDWLLDIVAPPPRSPPPAAPPRPHLGAMSAYAHAAFVREVREVALASKGARNATLYASARALGSLAAGGALSADDVVRALTAACAENGLLAEGRSAVDLTIASGLKAGLARPRIAPEGRR